MSQIIETVDVDVPVRVAYDQWTQFEEFPRFMKAVEKVEQLNDTTIRWTAEIAGVTKTWTAKITQQEPDQRVAWTSIDTTCRGVTPRSREACATRWVDGHGRP